MDGCLGACDCAPDTADGGAAVGGGIIAGLNIRGGGPLIAGFGERGCGGTAAASRMPFAPVESGWLNVTGGGSLEVSSVGAASGGRSGESTLCSRTSVSASGITTGGGGVGSRDVTAGGIAIAGAGFCGETEPGPTTGMSAGPAGAGLLRLRIPTVETGSAVGFRADVGLAAFFLLAFRSSLCLRRNSALSAFDIPCSTSGPVFLACTHEWHIFLVNPLLKHTNLSWGILCSNTRTCHGVPHRCTLARKYCDIIAGKVEIADEAYLI